MELIKVADFLGCSELVQMIEDLLIKELQAAMKQKRNEFTYIKVN